MSRRQRTASFLRPGSRCGLLLAFALVLVAAETGAAVYKYVDRQGVAHYTDSLSQVPDEYRDRVRDITADVGDMGFNVVEAANGPRAEAADRGLGETLGELGSLPSDTAVPGGEALGQLLDNFGFGVLFLILLAIPVLYVLNALILRLACRLAGEEQPGLGRACLILLAQAVAGGAVGVAFAGIALLVGIEEAGLGASLGLNLLSALCSWMVNAAILSAMLSCAFLRALWISVLHTLLVIVFVGVPVGLLLFLVVLSG
jgi:hypothetical protein